MAYPSSTLEPLCDVSQVKVRRVAFKAEVLVRDGNTLSWEDITPYVISASGTVARTSTILTYSPRGTSRSVSASATVVVRDTASHIFSPFNTSSPYEGKRWPYWTMNPIRLFWGFYGNTQAEMVPLFRGYIVSADVSQAENTVTFQCLDRSAKFRDAMAKTSLYVNVSPRAYLQFLSTYGLLYTEFDATLNYPPGDMEGVVLDTGTVASATTNSVTVQGKNWADNRWRWHASVALYEGAYSGIGQVRRIEWNTSNTLYVFPNFTVIPEAGLKCKIVLAQCLDWGSFVIPYAFADSNVWEEMQQVAEAQGGCVYFDAAGNLRFDDMHRLLTPQRNNPVVTISASRAHLSGTSASVQISEVVNYISVAYTNNYVGPYGVVWSADEAFECPAKNVYDWRNKMEYGANAHMGEIFVDCALPSPALRVATPRRVKDYVAAAGMRDITRDVTVTIDTARSNSSSVRLRIRNNTSRTAYITKLQLRGRPLEMGQDEEVVVWDNNSIRKYGRRALSLRNRYIQSPEQAYALARVLLDIGREPSPLATISIPAIPYLEPGDVVRVNLPHLSLSNKDMVIEEIRWSLSDATVGTGAAGAKQVLTLRSIPQLALGNLLVVGQDNWGTSRRYGY
ncbi:MAG: hypothetical protein ACUVS5_08620 [Anaerolineae bacterium]